MATTISKGKLFGVKLVVSDEQLKAMKQAPEYVNDAMEAGAFYWHSGILPEHFTRPAHGKYGYAQRCRSYLKRKGANPDLVRSGSMKADLLAKASAKQKGKGKGVELKMTSRALNFVPNSANPLDVYVKRSDGKNYPNMKREITAMVAVDEESVRKVIEAKLATLFSGDGSGGGKPVDLSTIDVLAK